MGQNEIDGAAVHVDNSIISTVLTDSANTCTGKHNIENSVLLFIIHE
jgi:hypothetical protein